MKSLILAALVAVLAAGCVGLTTPTPMNDADGDSDADIDGDSDTDSDGDSDADADEEVLCTFYRDSDGDGYGDPETAIQSICEEKGASYVENGLDCDDTDPEVNPEAEEICDDVDNDCDGEINEGVLNACGFCGPEPEEVCDGEDNDCDGEIDEDFDSDGDGFSSCDGDCDDDNELVYPGALELCDGLDNNCDTSGWIDEGIGFCYAGASSIRDEGEVDVLDDSSLSSNDSLAYDVGIDDVAGSLIFLDGAYAELAEPIGRPDLIDVSEFTVSFWMGPLVGDSILIGTGWGCVSVDLGWDVSRIGENLVFRAASAFDETRMSVRSEALDFTSPIFVIVTVSDEARIYIDGTLNTVGPTGEIHISSRHLRMGRGPCPASTTVELANVSFYPRALSEEEVTTLYNFYL